MTEEIKPEAKEVKETGPIRQQQGEGIFDEDENKRKNSVDNPDPLLYPEFVIDLNTKYDEDLVKQLQEEEGFEENI